MISRTKFSKQVRQKGNGYIPIVIDSYDIDMSKSLNMCLKKTDNHPDCVWAHYTYGVEIPFYIDSTIEDLKNYIYENEYIHDYIQNIKSYDFVLYTELESGSGLTDSDDQNSTSLDNKHILLKNDDSVGTLYKQYKDKQDNILYIYLLKSKSNMVVSIVEKCHVM
jgi:hypothetical protein